MSSFKTPFRATKICAHFVVWTKVDVYRQFIFLSSPSFVLVCCRADTGKETKIFIICRLTKIECVRKCLICNVMQMRARFLTISYNIISPTYLHNRFNFIRSRHVQFRFELSPELLSTKQPSLNFIQSTS